MRHRSAVALLALLLETSCGGATSNQAPASTLPPQSVSATIAPSISSNAPNAIWSDKIVDAIGVNTSFNNSGTPYVTDWSAISALLIASGIRHIRDGATGSPPWYYGDINMLATRGIRSLTGFCTSDTDSTIASYITLVPAVEGVEYCNEYDTSHPSSDTNWAATDIAGQQKLFADIKSNPAYSGVLVEGPSLAQIDTAVDVGNLSQFMDVGTEHDYTMCNLNPGNTVGSGNNHPPYGIYGTIAFTLSQEKLISGDRPVWTTETGYDDNPASSCYLPDAIIARYYPRQVLERWLSGISRTYFFQFANVPSDVTMGTLGMLDNNQNAKPQFAAIKNFIALLADPGGAFVPGSLTFQLAGVPASVHQLLMEKQNGTFYLALWNEVAGYNPSTEQMTSSTVVSGTLLLSKTPRSISQTTFADDGSVASTNLTTGSTVPLAITDHLTVLAIQP